MKFILPILVISAIALTAFETDPLKESIERGKKVYNDFCMVCHRPDGNGVKGVFPPLAQSDYLLNERKESIKAIKKGQSGIITVNGMTYNGTMAPLGLDDKEVADVMNYILNTWGNESNKMVTEAEVSEIE